MSNILENTVPDAPQAVRGSLRPGSCSLRCAGCSERTKRHEGIWMAFLMQPWGLLPCNPIPQFCSSPHTTDLTQPFGLRATKSGRRILSPLFTFLFFLPPLGYTHDRRFAGLQISKKWRVTGDQENFHLREHEPQKSGSGSVGWRDDPPAHDRTGSTMMISWWTLEHGTVWLLISFRLPFSLLSTGGPLDLGEYDINGKVTLQPDCSTNVFGLMQSEK